jgi:LmbE family N-acetylglucosaminyl deacetylase
MRRAHIAALSILVSLLIGIAVPAGSGQAVAQDPAYAAHSGFTFRDGRSRAIDVTLSDANGVAALTWPETAGEWDTALLRAQATVDPAAVMPYVEMSAAGVSDRQYFPASDSGQRWLNLTFLRGTLKPATTVTIRGEGIAIAPGSAALRLFAGAPDLTRSILILAPHPDDAEIAAFGVYAQRRASVVTVTAGNAGVPTYESVFDDLADLYLFKGRIRVIDSITVPWQGGIPPERTFNMGYFDARLAEMHDKRDAVIPEMYRKNSDIGVYRRENIGSMLPKRSRESTWDNLVDDTLSVLKKVNPAVIVAPHPQLDTHRDHQFTAVALDEALGRWRKRVTFLLYTNHADRNRYPYGPANTIVSLPSPLGAAGEIPVDAVYSHPVSPSIQRLKLFALESMHDLRFTPTRQYQLAKGEERAISPEKTGPEPDITYLRRAPRSNELFYVYDEESFRVMIQEFLKGRGGSR